LSQVVVAVEQVVVVEQVAISMRLHNQLEHQHKL
jgi:hypothetical protein